MIDTETTHLDTSEARVVSVAVVHVTLGQDDAVVVLDQRVNPGIPIPADATRVHGIRDEDVAGAPSFREVWPRVVETMRGRVPVAFNCVYDQQVLHHEAFRTSGLEVPPAWGTWLDPYVLVRGLDKFERGKNLRDAARRRGIRLDAHGAAGDAMTTALLLTTLLTEAARGVADRLGQIRFRSPKGATVEQYLRWQRDRALEQERDFAEYMAGQGRKDPVECPWHVLEGVAPPGRPERAKDESRTTATCSSCGSPLVWVVTQSGRKMACDPAVLTGVLSGAPEGARELFLVQENGDVSRVQEAPADWPGTRIEGRVSHFATCTDPDRWRRE